MREHLGMHYDVRCARDCRCVGGGGRSACQNRPAKVADGGYLTVEHGRSFFDIDGDSMGQLQQPRGLTQVAKFGRAG